jgi:two-component system nitrate/nitrite response regulator NarL
MALNDIRVLIVGESPLARAGLASMLGSQPGLVVAGQAAPDAALESALAAYAPDVLAWDLGWDAAAGLHVLADARDAAPPVLVLVSDAGVAPDALAQGAYSVMPQDASGDDLAAALMATARGLVVMTPDLLPATMLAPAGEAQMPADALTPRELEVLALVAEGLANKAIANRLGISDHTVKFHINAVMSKLGAQSRTEAVVTAMRLGLITL